MADPAQQPDPVQGERFTPWRGTLNICFVGSARADGYTDRQVDRIMDAMQELERHGIFDEGGSFGAMEDDEVLPGSPLARKLDEANS